MKKIILPLLIIVIAYGYQEWQAIDGSHDTATIVQSPAPTTTDSRWRPGSQVRGSGVVRRTLPDDNDGSRHQRFILELDSGRTVLIAHNIDLAPRVSSLSAGDSVSFYGVYEANERGGVIHWTHKDPQGRHVGGWLEHHGRRYQ